MITPVSLSDIADFVQVIIRAFENPIFYAFTFMMAFTIIMSIRKIFLGEH